MSNKPGDFSGNAENVDWSDIAMTGRAYADNLVGEEAVSKVMHLMADEIERLRLTPEEREAVEFHATLTWPKNSQQCKTRTATLFKFWERTK